MSKVTGLLRTEQPLRRDLSGVLFNSLQYKTSGSCNSLSLIIKITHNVIFRQAVKKAQSCKINLLKS